MLNRHCCPDNETTLESVKVVDCSPEDLEMICREHEKLSDTYSGNDSYYILETRVLPALTTGCNDYVQYLKDMYKEEFDFDEQSEDE